MMLHHWAAFLSVIAAAVSHQAHQYTLLLLFTELTTPFINARWIFDKLVSLFANFETCFIAFKPLMPTKIFML